jgi:hypothetical protein
VLESEDLASQYPGDYLRLAESFGTKKMSKEAMNVLIDLVTKDDVQVDSLMKSIRNESLRLVEQSKINTLYYRLSKTNKFESRLESEDVADSFKKALIALQNKE